MYVIMGPKRKAESTVALERDSLGQEKDKLIG